MSYDKELAKKYKLSKQQSLFKVYDYSLYNYIKDKIQNKSALDLACGDGHITRMLYTWGAKNIVGVDISKDMIDLANKEEEKNPLGIKYIQKSVSTLNIIDNFDVATASFLFENADNEKELLSMMESIAKNLNSNGKLFVVCFGGHLDRLKIDYSKFGIRFAISSINDDKADLSFIFDNYNVAVKVKYYSRSVIERNLLKAGFNIPIWHNPVLPNNLKNMELWSEFLTIPLYVILECNKKNI
ncbi:MAG: class I SAM-dependent methyltransferase [bacterium]|nr:class I SAM-dependent methyltransferase [bacterium]